jgi:hypothetical protein
MIHMDPRTRGLTIALVFAIGIIVILGFLVLRPQFSSWKEAWYERAEEREAKEYTKKKEAAIDKRILAAQKERPEFFACTADADCMKVSTTDDCDSCCQHPKVAINRSYQDQWRTEILGEAEPRFCLQGCTEMGKYCTGYAACVAGQCTITEKE